MLEMKRARKKTRFVDVNRVESMKASDAIKEKTRFGSEEEEWRTLVDVGGVGLLSGLGALLLVTGGGGGLLASLLLLNGSLASSRGLAAGGGSLLSCLGCHFD
jgi:hypothetical protein